MSSENKKTESPEPLEIGGIPLRGKAEEFDSVEMIDCAKCGRKSPPNRLECIYCGEVYVLEDEVKKKVRPVLREPGEEENALNLICFACGPLNAESVELLTAMTRLDEAAVEKLCGSGSAVPVAVTGSNDAALIASERLSELGFSVGIFSDTEIEKGKAFRRLRGLVSEDDKNVNFLLFNNDEVVRLEWSDIALIVVGTEVESSLETDEKHKKKKLEKVIATTDTVSDGILIDIYCTSDKGPFRIEAMSGFDFSFLGAEKEFVASGNIPKTIALFRDNAARAHIDESYPSIQTVLNEIWKPEEREDTKRIKMKGFGSFEKKKIQTTSNLKQFGMYSRLQRLALKQKTEI